jgi:lipopolysaccharide/colanic/teichoic acid biosynthesis glycosyltransferase
LDSNLVPERYRVIDIIISSTDLIPVEILPLETRLNQVLWQRVWYNEEVTPEKNPTQIPIAKRVFDLALTIPGLILLSPAMAVVAIWIRIKAGRPVIFAQARPGRQGMLFNVYKFRTMTDECDAQGNLLPDKARLPRWGRFLRATSLDELPELVNVLRGEMSLVGPRPLLARYLERYTPEQARRHEVRPGITGWAQVNGRNALNWEDKFRLDVWYVDHWSFWFDLRILGMTLWKVFRREGISQPGQATAEEFMGSEKVQE